MSISRIKIVTWTAKKKGTKMRGSKGDKIRREMGATLPGSSRHEIIQMHKDKRGQRPCEKKKDTKSFSGRRNEH